MGVKSLVQGLNVATTAGFDRGPFDPKSDAVTDWPLPNHNASELNSLSPSWKPSTQTNSPLGDIIVLEIIFLYYVSTRAPLNFGFHQQRKKRKQYSIIIQAYSNLSIWSENLGL